MRIVERQGKAWQALLREAGKAPVLVYFRGVDSKDQALWEITWKNGQSICTQGTEREVMQALEGPDNK